LSGAFAVAAVAAPWPLALAQTDGDQPAATVRTVPAPRTLDINELRVEGADRLTAAEVEAAVGPFVGPKRTLEDVEKARAALEKTYSDKGYQSVVVSIPQQTVRQGVITLKVTEGKIGRLHVRGTKWFSPFEIRRHAPSVAEGVVPNFNDIVRDIYVLNQWPDRRITPLLRAGAIPGTVDVDLLVQETFPLHASVEVNDRYSVNTTHTRINGFIHYDNLWQLGHSLGFSFQIAPKRPSDAKVFGGNYLARFPGAHWLTLSFNAVIQDSDVSTLGGTAVTGRGRIFGARATFTLPGSAGFFHSITTGFDYKLFLENVAFGTSATSAPVHYWPLTAQYGASWFERRSQTQFGITGVFNIRGLSSNDAQFDAKRYKASSMFAYLRGELSRTDELPLRLQTFVRVSGQFTGAPLIGPEQFTAGGVDTVRGYLEVEAVGDYGALGSLELRSPSVIGPPVGDWRFHVFTEGGRVWLHDALPEQKVFSTLWSVGGGTRLRLFEHLSGGFDIGIPLTSAGSTPKYQPRFHFRVVGEI